MDIRVILLGLGLGYLIMKGFEKEDENKDELVSIENKEDMDKIKNIKDGVKLAKKEKELKDDSK